MLKQYTCVHVKKGAIEVEASTSYGAAQEAAKQWKLKSTAGIDAYLNYASYTPPYMENHNA